MSHRIVRVYVEVQVQVHVQVHEYPQCQVCPAVSAGGGAAQAIASLLRPIPHILRGNAIPAAFLRNPARLRAPSGKGKIVAATRKFPQP
jgi:hypothetical protein